MYFAAIDTSLEWQGGHICGQCMEVTILTSQGPKSVVVRIMDKCPDANCGIDLGGSAPGAVMSNGSGRYQGAWRAVSCVGHSEVSDGAPSLWIKDGASSGWSIVQVRNGNAAVTSIDWQNASDASKKGTLAWATEAENFFSIPTSILSANASFVFTIHYSDGSTGTVTLTSAQLSKPSTTYPLN
jgi:expansin (peptidoglycan-binding protein)